MEDTQTTQDIENRTLLEEMLKAEAAPEPDKGDKVVNRGDDKVPTPMIFSKLESAGYSYIYDRKTGERSSTNNNMLPTQLRKKNKDGSLRFTITKPPFEPKKGVYKCLLHRSSPNRTHYDEMGLPTCNKDSLINPFQVTRHMQKRHKMEWAALEQERAEAEKLEERNFQRGLMGQALIPKPEVPKPAERELYVSDKKKK